MHHPYRSLPLAQRSTPFISLRWITHLAAAMLFTAATACAEIGLRLRVSGYEDVDAVSTILATDGVTAYVGTVSGHGHQTGWNDPQPIAWDAEGNPTEWDEGGEYFYGFWTEYRVLLPEGWLGRGVSFSRNGTAWTSFRLFNGNDPDTQEEQVVSIDELEWGQRTIPDPDSYVTEQGNRLRLGDWWSDENREVFSILSWDNDNASWPCIGMDIHASTANAYWRWFHPTDDGQATQMVMSVDPDHNLSLFGRSGGLIVLEPETGRITINGRPVLAPDTTPGAMMTSNTTLQIGAGTVVRSAASQSGQIVLGKYNRTTGDGTSGVFVVGSGTNSGSSGRKNGLRILEDGTVLIWPAGDLEMAEEFKEGPLP